MDIATTRELRQQIRNPYTSPGCYPVFLLTSDAACLCMSCARAEYRSISHAMRHRLNDGWRVVAADINWEDPELYCDHCSGRIESAYAEDDAED